MEKNKIKELLLILFLLPFLFISCEKDDPANQVYSYNTGNNNTSESILGMWLFQNSMHTEQSGYIDPVISTEIITSTNTTNLNWSSDLSTLDYLDFRSNNTGTEYIYIYDSLLTSYSLEGQSEWTYIKDGNNIEIFFTDGDLDPITISITNLTSTDINWYIEWPTYTLIHNDTTFFEKSSAVQQLTKSTLPSITVEPLNKKEPESYENSFLIQKNNRINNEKLR